MKYFKLFINFFFFSLMQQTEYRIDFLMGILQGVGWFVVGIIGIQVMFDQTNIIAGWNKNEIIIMYCIFRLTSELWWFLFSLNLREITNHIREGTFDYILVKPISTQFISSFRNILIFAIPNLLLSTVLIIYFSKDIEISAVKILVGILLILNGLGMLYSLMLMLATISFWTTRLQAFWEIYGILTEGARYPTSFYKQPLNFIFTFIIPLAIIFTLPAQYLTDSVNIFHVLGAFGLGILFFYISHKFFYYGIKRYNSASS